MLSAEHRTLSTAAAGLTMPSDLGRIAVQSQSRADSDSIAACTRSRNRLAPYSQIYIAVPIASSLIEGFLLFFSHISDLLLLASVTRLFLNESHSGVGNDIPLMLVWLQVAGHQKVSGEKNRPLVYYVLGNELRIQKL